MDTHAMRIVAIGHPSLITDVAAFLAELRDEPRRFGPTASPVAKPFPSILRRLEEPADIRMGVYEDRRLIALGAVADDGEITLAVTRDRRADGVGRDLLIALVERSHGRGHRRLVLPASRRSSVLLDIAAELGAVAVDLGRGRVELVFDARPGRPASGSGHVA
jgi:GNAT superfamily N-acetyltransferase